MAIYSLLSRSVAPVAALLALMALARVARDTPAGAELGYFLPIFAQVLAAVAALSSPRSRVPAAACLALPLTAWALAPVPGRGALLATLGLTALVFAGREALRRTPAANALAAFVPLALGLQALARGEVWLTPPPAPRLWVVTLVLPALAGAAAAWIARARGVALAGAVAGGLFALGGGLRPWNVLALLVLAALAQAPWQLAPRHGRRGFAGAAGVAGVTGMAVAASTLAAGYPWHARPQTLFAHLDVPFRAKASLTSTGPVVLSPASPHFVRRVPPGFTPRELVIESSLALAAQLPAGTPVATIRLNTSREGRATLSLRVGEHTGEWAARRPDLVAAGVPAPPAWRAWVDPAGFFGQRYRAVLPLAAGEGFESCEVRLRSDLPREVQLTLFAVELRQ